MTQEDEERITLPAMPQQELDSVREAAERLTEALATTSNRTALEATAVAKWFERDRESIQEMYTVLSANATAVAAAAKAVQSIDREALRLAADTAEAFARVSGDMHRAHQQLVAGPQAFALDAYHQFQAAVRTMANSISVNSAIVGMLEGLDDVARSKWEIERDGDRVGIKRVQTYPARTTLKDS